MLKAILRSLNRKLNTVNWHQLRQLEPVSAVFGLDRGTPVDRYYIESFLLQHQALIKGVVLEIAASTYSKKYGHDVECFEVLHTQPGPAVTIVGDLTQVNTLPANAIDCFICTQTFNFIYDFQAAIRGAHRLLKPGGWLLATMAGISQISRYDMDRWGDYWRFTTRSAVQAFGEVFGRSNITVLSHGNVLASIAFLEGIAAEELTPKELDYKDDDYQLLITVAARKEAQ